MDDAVTVVMRSKSLKGEVPSACEPRVNSYLVLRECQRLLGQLGPQAAKHDRVSCTRTAGGYTATAWWLDVDERKVRSTSDGATTMGDALLKLCVSLTRLVREKHAREDALFLVRVGVLRKVVG